MISEGFEEMFEGDFAEMCTDLFSLMRKSYPSLFNLVCIFDGNLWLCIQGIQAKIQPKLFMYSH